MRTRYLLPVLTVVTAMSLSGCVNNSEPASTAAASGTADAVTVKKNDTIAAMLPGEDQNGRCPQRRDGQQLPAQRVQGRKRCAGRLAVDLTKALGEVLGLKVNFDIGTFDNILPP